MSCVCSVTYTVLLNGQTHGLIKPERALRQGDPLSPFLFLLCAKALIHVMQRSSSEGKISGIRLTPSCPVVQQLLFADDSLFLGRADETECGEILRCLDLYGKASGQRINFQKSSLTFGSYVANDVKDKVKEIFGIQAEGRAGT